ncbi:MAG TPA: L-serine ammonia-lyase, iron-sulfur-dependent, subunit alpha [Candidatus Blautia avicola]|uniref:UPF0597 protein H9914_10610 n=1 Tax=Candidatus Blautia avicola TaxID=2838483 RepID=A0A9D2TWW4_9FIRM|nr:L-serine ammonia-lyase, iron-sulfur-dependent, subunit alpha [Candidatus Blautia avicola]
MREEEFIDILKRELMPALGCTEPIAIAYASAKARAVLGRLPDMVSIKVSSNILKNAMGVGIPGTHMVGLEIAAALGVIGGDSEAILEVLHKITKADIQNAKDYVKDHVKVSLKDTEKKLYIEVEARTSDDSAQVIIEDSHTNITRIQHGAFTIFEKSHCRDIGETGHGNSSISVEEIYHFIENVNAEKLGFLKETISLNWDIAQEGISGEYGLSVGRSIYESQISGGQEYRPNTQEYAAALTAAAADARMAGCKLPVMTVCGSGNQGITATVPVIAVARKEKYSEELLYKAVALSCLITTHVKKYIGKLSPLCGCGMGSSIGVCCALIYMRGGTLEQIKSGIKNMIADVSGIICDGAKSGCALKIATVVSSAFQCAVLALRNSSAGELDGIVSDNVETTIRNLGELGNKGMCNTDKVILNMMVCK